MSDPLPTETVAAPSEDDGKIVLTEDDLNKGGKVVGDILNSILGGADAIDEMELKPIFGAFLPQLAGGNCSFLPNKEKWLGCSGKGQFCCLQSNCCLRKDLEPLKCYVFDAKCAIPTSICKIQFQACCLVESCSAPADNEVPPLVTCCGITLLPTAGMDSTVPREGHIFRTIGAIFPELAATKKAATVLSKGDAGTKLGEGVVQMGEALDGAVKDALEGAIKEVAPDTVTMTRETEPKAEEKV